MSNPILWCPFCKGEHNCTSSSEDRVNEIHQSGSRAHVHFDGCGRTFYETETGVSRSPVQF